MNTSDSESKEDGMSRSSKAADEPVVHSCHVQMTYYGNPQQRAFREYTQKLAAEGHRVTVIAAGRPHDSSHEMNQERIEIFRIPVRSIRKWSVEPIVFALRAIRILEKVRSRVDVVHCYTSWEMAFIGLYCRIAGLPCCYDIRSGPMSGGWRYQIGVQIQKYIAKIFNTCIVISDPLGKVLFGSNEDLYEVVAIGTDLDRFQPVSERQRMDVRQHLTIPRSVPLAVYCGIMRESKGAREVTGIAIRACQRSNDLHFLIVGGGDDLEKQKRRVQQTAFAERVHFTGQVDPDEVPYYLGAADLALSYVPQNDLYDPQPPLKTAEYLACELPVVATDTQGQRIYLKHGDNGWLYEDDLDVLSDGIVELMGRPEIKNRIRTRARSSIQSFSWDKIVRQQLIRVYRKTIASQKT